jgi:hypothetical protein
VAATGVRSGQSTAAGVLSAVGGGIPLFGLFALAVVGIMSVFRRLSDRWNLVGGLCLFAAFGLTFFCLLGKVIVESLFALMPLLAEKRLEQKRQGRPGPAAPA